MTPMILTAALVSVAGLILFFVARLADFRPPRGDRKP